MRKIKQVGVILATLLMTTTTVFGAENSTVGTVIQNGEAYTSPQVGERTCYIFEGESFEVVDTLDEYYAVLLDNQEVVYVDKAYIEVEEQEEVKEKVQVAEQAKSTQKQEEIKTVVTPVTESKGEQIVQYAKKFIGTPYVKGGKSLTSGVDCSGFTQQVFSNFNIKLQRTSGSQYANNGIKIQKKDLKPGDLVFYGYSSVSHVAIYVGNSQVIHAPAPGQKVCIAPLWQRGDAPLIGYKRVV